MWCYVVFRDVLQCLGLARTIHIRCVYGIFGREIIKYTVIYGVYIRFGPTLAMSCNVMWCYVVLCGVMWRHVMSCDAMRCSVVLCNVM